MHDAQNGSEATSAHQQNLALRASEERTRAIVEAALDCIITMDHAGRIVAFNPAAERAFGFRSQEVIGQEMATLIIPPSLRDAHRAGLAHYLATGEGPILGTRLEVTALRADGSEFPVELTVTRLPSDGPALFAGFIRDITERIQAERRLAVQYAVSRVLAEARTVDEMTAHVLAAIGQAMGWQIGAFWQADAARALIRCVTVWQGNNIEAGGFEAASRAVEFSPGVGLPGRVWADDKAAWVPDVLTLPNFPRCQAASAQGLRAAFAFPIRQNGAVPGIIEFFSRDVQPPDDDLLRVVETLGSQIGQFLQRRAAEQALQIRAEREALVNRIGQALRRSTDPETIQSTATAALGEALGVDRCYFARYDLSRDRVVVGGDWQRPGLASLSGEYRISGLNLDPEALYAPDTPVVIPDAHAVAKGAKAVSAAEFLGLRAVIGIGLFEEERLVAALHVAMAEAARDWAADEIALVRDVATLTRSAIEAARVQEREHNIADRLQEALRPALPGKVPGLDIDTYYSPALAEASVGGDFFDVFPVEKDCFALVVADLAGKGLAAAAQVATVRHMLRTLMYLPTTISEAVTRLNDLLLEHDLLAGFATLFVGVYDVNARTLTYVSCGQEPGLIYRRAENRIEELPPTGAILGGFRGARFEERTVLLSPGDALALFTDGITEAGPSRKDMLEVPGVSALLRDCCCLATTPPAKSAEALTACLMDGVRAFATTQGIRDDVCLLIAVVEDGSGGGGGRS